MKISAIKANLTIFLALFDQEILTEGEGSVQLTSFTNWIRTAHFYIENIIFLFTKQATLMRRPTVLSCPPQLVFPG
jgi:hypothetical protein